MPRGRPQWRWLLAGAFVVAAALIGAAQVRSAVPASFQELEESLTCQCGCGLTVGSCNHLQCDSAMPLRAEIRGQMETGKDKDAILTYFSGKYGEKILSSPTASGFNILAWVTPFVLLGLGGVFLGVTMMRWTVRRRVAPEPTAPQPRAPSPYDKILEKDLKNFDG
jgi:cytochrome c-type biogenesis protein CcmH